MFQSTPPHGGRHADELKDFEYHLVSIHAPAWGATRRYRNVAGGNWRFNPRPRMGGDAYNFMFI